MMDSQPYHDLEPASLPDTLSPLEMLFYVSERLQPQISPDLCRSQWDEMLAEAAAIAGHEPDLTERWQRLWHLFYRQWQFCASEHYFSVESSMMDSILLHKDGNAASLAIILHSLCRKLGLNAYLVDFPGQLLLSIPEVNVDFLDPLTGEMFSRRELEVRVRGHLGNLTQLSPEHLKAASDQISKQRFLDGLKQACLLQEAFSEGLFCSEILLKMTPDDPQQILERGFILQNLDYHQGAAADFSFFVEQCPEHPNAELLKLQISMLQEQDITFH